MLSKLKNEGCETPTQAKQQGLILAVLFICSGLFLFGCDKTCECNYTPTEPTNEAVIEVTSPDSTVVAWLGHPLRFAWTSENVLGSVKIYYSRNDGDTWPFTITENAYNEGEYFWTVDAPLTRSGRIRVQSAGEPPAVGESPSSFVIQTYVWAPEVPSRDFTVNVLASNGVDLFAVGSGGTINQRSSQTGEWVIQNCATTRPLNDIHFADSLVGWVCGGSGVLRRTVDGGQTWLTTSSQISFEIRAIHCYDSLTAIAAVAGLRRTSDAGESWDQVVEFVGETINRLYFYDSMHAFAVGEDGLIAKSVDGGLTWEIKTSPFEAATYKDIHSPDGLTYYAVASEGQIAKSDDGGETWHPLNLLHAPVLSSIRSMAPLEILVTTADSRLLHSVDGGDTWVYYSVDEGHYFNTLLMETDGSGWFAGTGNAVFHLDIEDSE
ncbi:MAG: hypothetical protein KDB65_09355 [Calditrichaeota bacterium]|nr:hypothetical protein [Calditrichota bacterium]MCB9369394.1 hypothetical protein [Calditrichota bacterium]